MPSKKTPAFWNTVEVAGETFKFCECKKGCRAEEYIIRDQIIIGTTNNAIREKAMLKTGT